MYHLKKCIPPFGCIWLSHYSNDKKNLVIFLQKLINSSNHDKKTKHNNEKAICTEKPIWNNMWCIFFSIYTTQSFISISTNYIDPNKKNTKLKSKQMKKNYFFGGRKKLFVLLFVSIEISCYWLSSLNHTWTHSTVIPLLLGTSLIMFFFFLHCMEDKIQNII